MPAGGSQQDRSRPPCLDTSTYDKSERAADRAAARLKSQRESLPVWKHRWQLVPLLKENKTLILVGETGTGKSTLLPQLLLDYVLVGAGVVACTQPRRVAATTIAHRVARERRVALGEQVGYCVRFDDRTSHSTRLKYMTDGMLLREALLDPLLCRYKAIILDEAHERTVQTDVLFSLVKSAQKQRQDLRVIVMSATLDAEKFVKYFSDARAVYLQGRQFPVDICYLEEAEQSYIDAAIRTVLQLHDNEGAGDILVFLTGQEEIENVAQLLIERAPKVHGPAGAEQLTVLALFAAQTPDQQAPVFRRAPHGTRKVILATNIAETSLTVPGVRFVVDTGFVKARLFRPDQADESLQVVPISQAQARQRSGRAGREAPGKAFRLYTENAFWSLRPVTSPEIQRARLDTVCLQLKALGIQNPLEFDFMDPPPVATLVRALEQLYALGALDDDGQLTKPLGVNLAKLPIEPALGKFLITAAGAGCLNAALAVAAATSADQFFVTSRQKQEAAREVHKVFVNKTGDHLTQLAVFVAFSKVTEDKQKWCHDRFLNHRSLRRAQDIFKQLARYMKSIGHQPEASGMDWLKGDPSGESLRKALTSGLLMNAAALHPDGCYRILASSQMVHIHPSSVLCGKRAKCIVFGELTQTTRKYARNVTAIEAAWLPELGPSLFSGRGLPMQHLSP